ncbi:trimeric intracellular cation channel family protein [Shewanella sp. TC10]|uniref:trimeric intracellular cation channel family protein n=1 Tax=Shewanella sp. TC10 TaxID=1419739 RepID=UPI00129D3B4E|nr:trimeric intracellular cation channel family protein [Shewanella sp. TC10]
MYITSSLIISTITVLGTAAFALSAVFAASEKKADVFTVLVLGITTAVGGGTIRDCILNVPVFWSEDMQYIWIAILSCLIGFIFFPIFKIKQINRIYLYIDAVAIAMFAIQGTEKAWSLGFGLPIAPIILGVITAIGGGVIRDMLIQRQTLFLSKELYAIPVALGCTIHAVVLAYLPSFSNVSAIVSILIVVYIRHLAINKDLQVPSWAIMK